MTDSGVILSQKPICNFFGNVSRDVSYRRYNHKSSQNDYFSNNHLLVNVEVTKFAKNQKNGP